MLRVKRAFGSLGEKITGIARRTKDDYLATGKDTLEEIKEKPFKSILYSGLVTLLAVSYNKNPNEKKYESSLTLSTNKLLLLSDTERNKVTDSYIQDVAARHSKNLLRFCNLGLFSIVYTSKYSKHTKSCVSQSKYVNPRWHEFPERITDFGFMGKWWHIHYRMTDYDVDFEKYPKDLKHSYDKIKDFVKTLYGTGYYNDIKSQPIKTIYFVPTAANDDKIAL